jgi:Uncharacterised nucleotidyltransferase
MGSNSTFRGHTKTLDLRRVRVVVPDYASCETLRREIGIFSPFHRKEGMRHLDHDSDNLLRAVVHSRAEERAEKIAELASKIDCWEETIEDARQHGILPLLYSELSAIEPIIPPAALELARTGFERNAFHCIANAAELLDVLKEFQEAGIAAMPFKGVVLGASAYGDITARTAGDVDVLIYYRDLLRATNILKKRGYDLKTKTLEDGSPEANDYFEYHLQRASDGMVLELRWRLELSQPRYRHDLGMDWVWPRRRTTSVAGADVPNFDAISGLLMLCMHGSKHVWSRLIWICDVAKLLESEPGLDWDFAQREAKRVGLWRCLALGVLLAQRVAGAQVPAGVLRRFERDRTARKVAEVLEMNLLEAPGSIPGGAVPYDIRLMGLGDRVQAAFSLKMLLPTARDRAIVKLPKALGALYFVIRPFRLLLDRAGR